MVVKLIKIRVDYKNIKLLKFALEIHVFKILKLILNQNLKMNLNKNCINPYKK